MENNNQTKVKMIAEMRWIREVLDRYCPSIRGLKVKEIPDELTVAELFEQNRLTEDQIRQLGIDAMSARKMLSDRAAAEVAEFGSDIDLNDDRFLWEGVQEKEKCVRSIEKRYQGRTGEIVFYGPSNITLWYSLEKDMLPYVAQNHGMGGCTDEDLIHYADRLLYPFQPKAVFFQSGSNDLTYGLSVEQIVENKKKMYSLFLKKLPDSDLVIMSGLPLPGRTVYWNDTEKINHFLCEYAETHKNLHYMNATDVMMSDQGSEDMRADNGKYFIPEYFRIDQIHLNKRGHDVWTKRIKETLKTLGY